MTWKDLKKFCNNLPEKELEKKVIVWREEECVSIEAMVLDEDHYIDPENDENGCFPESQVKNFIDDEEEYPNGIADFKKVYDKGHPILWEDF